MRAPVMFIGHGSPGLALEASTTTQRLKYAGRYLKDVNAILIVSAHWVTESLEITGASVPGILHDFYGFPAELYSVKPQIEGDALLAEKIAHSLSERRVGGEQRDVFVNEMRGLDHGVWAPLLHVLSESSLGKKSLPVIQLSLPRYSSLQAYFDLGKALVSWRDQGVAIIGSGSLTHNLHKMRYGENADENVAAFENWACEQIEKGNWQGFIDAPQAYPEFSSLHPTLEHYLPLLLSLGALTDTDQAHILHRGVVMGVISMASYVFTPAGNAHS